MNYRTYASTSNRYAGITHLNFVLSTQAICNRCSPGSDEFNATDAALTAVNKVTTFVIDY